MLKFSIVITTYRRLSLLRRAVESALAQTVPCEVVVVDDCSNDGTEEYVRSLGDRVVYYRNPVNLGHSAAVNAGVEIAQGDWIKPVDDDDYLAPDCIQEMIRAIAQHPQAAICSCQGIQVDANGQELSITRRVGSGKACYIHQEDIHYGMLLEQVPFGTPIQVAFRKDAFVKSKGWDTSLTSCDDIDSWIKIAQYGDAIFINQPLAYRTIWPGGYDQKISLQKRRDTNILMKEKIYALVSDKHRSSLPSLQEIRVYLQLHWSIVGLKQKEVLMFLKTAYHAMFAPTAWMLVIKEIYHRKHPKAHLIHKELTLPAELNLYSDSQNTGSEVDSGRALAIS